MVQERIDIIAGFIDNASPHMKKVERTLLKQKSLMDVLNKAASKPIEVIKATSETTRELTKQKSLIDTMMSNSLKPLTKPIPLEARAISPNSIGPRPSEQGPQQISKIHKILLKVSLKAKEIGLRFKTWSKGLKKTKKEVSSVGEKLDKVHGKGEKIGILMGLIFGGMTLKRWGQSILRFVIPSMDKMEGYQNRMTKNLGGLNAAFEFLKFTMFEAQSQSDFFQGLIGGAMKFLDIISRLTNRFPVLAMWLGVGGTILVGLGQIMALVGGVYQFKMLTDILRGVNAIKTGADAATASVTALQVAAGLLGAGLVFAGLFKEFKLFQGDDFDLLGHVIAALGLISGGALIGWSVGGPGGAAIGATIGLGISLVLTGLDFVNKWTTAKAWEGIKDMFGGEENPMLALSKGVGLDGENPAEAFARGYEGTLVPEAATTSWKDFGNLINTTAIGMNESINNKLIQGDNAIFPMLDAELMNVGTTAQNQVIDRWDNWEPKTKTLKIKVEKSGSGDGPSFSGNAFSSSITG